MNPKVETLGYLGDLRGLSPRLEKAARGAAAPRRVQPSLPLAEVDEPLFADSPALAAQAARTEAAVAANTARRIEREREAQRDRDAAARLAAQRGGRR